MSVTLRMSSPFVIPKIIRFLLVGGLNTLVGFLVFSLAIYLSNGNVGLGLAANIGFGVFFNYLTYGAAVFKSMGVKKFIRFVFAYAFLCAVNYFGLRILIHGKINIYVAQFASISYLAPLSYFLFSNFVFVDVAKKEGHERYYREVIDL